MGLTEKGLLSSDVQVTRSEVWRLGSLVAMDYLLLWAMTFSRRAGCVDRRAERRSW